MITEHLPVVRTKEQQTIVEETSRLQCIKHLSQLLVNGGDLSIIMPPHACDILRIGRIHVDHRLVAGRRVHMLVRGVLRRFIVQLPFAKNGRRHLAAFIQIQVSLQRIPRLVRPGKTHLQKERFLALVVADPGLGRIADKHIRVKLLF